MSDDLKALAKELKKAGGGFQVGSVEVWGILTLRPGDSIFDLVSVKAAADRLDLELEHRSGQRMKLSVWSPAGFSKSAAALVIESATRVQAEGGLDVERDGDKLLVRGTDGKTTTRKLPKNTPAFALR